MLETALVLIVMLVFSFGVIDFAMTIFLQSTFQHAARESVRFAIAFPSTYGSTDCTATEAACIIKVVQDNAAGFLSGLKSSYLTVNYYAPDDLGNPVTACTSSGCTNKVTLPKTMANGTQVIYPNQPGNVIEVVVNNYPWNWLIPIPGYFSGTSINLGGSSSDVLGSLTRGAQAPPNP